MEAEKGRKKQNPRKNKLQDQVKTLIENKHSKEEETINALKKRLGEMEKKLKAAQTRGPEKALEENANAEKIDNAHVETMDKEVEINKQERGRNNFSQPEVAHNPPLFGPNYHEEIDNAHVETMDEEVESKQQERGRNFSQPEVAHNPQLFGPNYHEEMVDIGNGIFCRKIIHEMALGGSTRPSSFARKLIEGVYKKEIILQGTITGQTARAQGKERQMETVVPLDYEARRAIIDYAIETGQKRKWGVQTEEKIQRSMCQSISERKAKFRKMQ